MPAPANRLVIALAQIPAHRRRHRRQCGAAETRPAPRPPAFGADIVMTPELFLAGYPPEDLVLKPAFQEACRAACDQLARETADGGPAVLVGLPVGREGQAPQRDRAPRRRPDRGGAVQGRPAELRGVRREAGVRAGPVAGADRVPRRPHRRADLRGHLGPGPGRVHPRDGRRDPARPQRAHLTSATSSRSGTTSRSTAWSRAACRSSISTWSADRTRSCSRARPSR